MASWCLPVLVSIGLLFPMAMLAKEGLTSTGVREETTGYRYFHTLRILYGEHERPYQSQGYVSGLLDMGIQLLLSAAGMPPTALENRIHLFIFLSGAVWLLAAAAAYAWAIRPITNPWARLAIGAALITVAYEPRSGAGFHLIGPGHSASIYSISLVAAGWLLRLAATHNPVGLRDAGLLGIFGGICLAIKPTYVILAVVVGALIVLRRPLSGRGWAVATASAPLALGFWVLLVWAYYLGDINATSGYFVGLNEFRMTVGNPQEFGPWFAAVMLTAPPDSITLSLLLPAALVVNALLLPRRDVSLSLFIGSVLFAYVTYKRAYFVTFKETGTYALVGAIIWLAAVGAPWASALPAVVDFARSRIASLAAASVALGLCGLALFRIGGFVDTWMPPFAASDAASRRLHTWMAQTPGRTIFLLPDNNYRPITIDTAVLKGGMDSRTSIWGGSELVRHLFDDRWYLIGAAGGFSRPVDIFPYGKLVFVSLTDFGGEAAAMQQIERVYGVSTQALDCSFRADTLAMNVMSERGFWPIGDWRLLESVIIGCRRPLEMVPQEASIPVWYARSYEPPQDVIRDAMGERVDVPAGHYVYSARSGRLWRPLPDGAVALVSGEPGRQIRVAGLGEWDTEEQALRGQWARSDGTEWAIDEPPMLPANPDPWFDRGTSTTPLPERWIAPADAGYTIERLVDADGPFVRIRVTQPGPYLAVVESLAPAPDGAPLSARGRIRGKSSGPATLTLYDVDTGSNVRARTASTHLIEDDWRQLTVRGPALEAREPAGHVSLGLYGVAPGDWFDLRELALFVGVLSPDPAELEAD